MLISQALSKVLDTTNSLDQRSLDIIHTALLEKYYGENDRYPASYEGIIIHPLGVDAFEAVLHIEGSTELKMKFSGRKLLSKAVKLPARDLTDKNIR